MIEVIQEQVTIRSEEEYWIIDLDENNLEFSPQELKDQFLEEETVYLGLKFKIIGIEFFKNVKDKIVLIVKEII
jgi:hypothetical protein